MQARRSSSILIFLGSGLLVTAVLSFFSGANAAPPTKFDSTIEQAKKQLDQKHYAESEKLLKGLEASNASLPPNDMKRVKAYNLLLSVYYGQNKLAEASEVFAKIIPILKHNYGVHDRDYAQALNNYASLLKQLGRATDAKAAQTEAAQIENPGLTLGYINKNGQLVIKWQQEFFKFSNCYMLPGPFSEGLAAVYQGNPEGKIVYINTEGQQAIPAKWDRGLPFHDGCAQVYSLSNVALIDKQGKVRVPPQHDFFPTQRSEGLWPSSGGSSYRDDNGATVLNLPYSSLHSFHEGLAGVAGKEKPDDVNSSWGFIDKTGKLAIPLRFLEVKNFSEGLAPFQERSNSSSGNFQWKWGYVSKAGSRVIEPEYKWAEEFSEGLACVGDCSDTARTMRFGFVNKTGNLVVPMKYDWAESYSEGLALVHLPRSHDRFGYVFRNGKSAFIDKSGSWAFVDKTGKIVLSPTMAIQEISSFSQGLARVKVGGLYGFIDKTGKLLVKPQYKWADDFSEDLAAVAVW